MIFPYASMYLVKEKGHPHPLHKQEREGDLTTGFVLSASSGRFIFVQL